MDLMRKLGFMKYSDGDGVLATSIAIFFGAFSSFLDWIWVNTVKLGRRWMKSFLSIVLDLIWRMAPLRVLQSSNFLPVVLFSSKMARVCFETFDNSYQEISWWSVRLFANSWYHICQIVDFNTRWKLRLVDFFLVFQNTWICRASSWGRGNITKQDPLH